MSATGAPTRGPRVAPAASLQPQGLRAPGKRPHTCALRPAPAAHTSRRRQMGGRAWGVKVYFQQPSGEGTRAARQGGRSLAVELSGSAEQGSARNTSFSGRWQKLKSVVLNSQHGQQSQGGCGWGREGGTRKGYWTLVIAGNGEYVPAPAAPSLGGDTFAGLQPGERRPPAAFPRRGT